MYKKIKILVVYVAPALILQWVVIAQVYQLDPHILIMGISIAIQNSIYFFYVKRYKPGLRTLTITENQSEFLAALLDKEVEGKWDNNKYYFELPDYEISIPQEEVKQLIQTLDYAF